MIIKSEDAAKNENAGGKARALGHLLNAYYNVPPFFVIINGEIPDVDALQHSLDGLGVGPFAVRSSALQEDGNEHSHAGQYQSILNVAKPDIIAAITQVLESAGSAALIEYRTQNGLEGKSNPPAVIIQQMINADKAGVAFSANPVDGNRNQIVISAINGLADKLVSGEVDGTEYWYDKTTKEVKNSDAETNLTDAEINKIANLAINIENYNNCPQDIEWAIKGDELFLLQSRPITSQLRPQLTPDDGISVFDNSNIIESYPGIVSPLTFSFASYAYARVYTSFVGLLGVGQPVINNNRVVFENMLARLGGRVYYNLGNWYRALAMLPGYRLNASYMETMMGVGEPLPEPLASQIGGKDAKGFARIGEYLKITKVAFGLMREAATLKLKSANFRKRLNRALDATTPERLGKMPITELVTEYRQIEGDLLDRWDAPIINDFFCMIAFGASRKLMEKYLGADGLEIHNDVLIGQGDIISAKPAQMIREMGAIVRDNQKLLLELHDGIIKDAVLNEKISAYINQFGDRCTEELKLESVTLDENPNPLYAAIIAAAYSAPKEIIRNENPMARLEKSLAEKSQPEKPFITSRFKLWIARFALNVAKNRVRDRENLRYERTRIFGRARRLFLALGRQFYASNLIDDPRDVFFLTVQEILGASEGNCISNDLKSIITIRKSEQEKFAKLPEPPERIIIKGAVANATNFANNGANIENNLGDALSQNGTGCSAGNIIAIARVIKDPFTETINAGEILVARNTDPGWIALFASAAAIVVERGSLLSHSAIVSRELGIPCVVRLRGATEWIKDGETIAVDGATGKVTKILNANGAINEN